MQPIILATANADKVVEIRRILTGVELLPRPDDVPDVDETEDTLIGNARLKAQALVDATGLSAVADDTGLFVDALNGAPGVRSARYAGEDAVYANNVAKLMREMADVPSGKRTASFRTVALLRFPDGQEIIGEGAVSGCIAGSPTGDDGFGYDPVFIPDEGDGRTFAQMGRDEKNTISHRGRAFRSLWAQIRT
jgi:XTP/dITP diphosphohydrolase